MTPNKKVSWLEVAGLGLAAGVALPPLMGWTVPVWAWWALPWSTLAKIAGLGGAAYGVWRVAGMEDFEQTVNDRDAARYLIGDQRTGKTTLASLWFAADIRTPHTWSHRGHRYEAANERGAAWVTTHVAKDIAALVPADRLTLFSPPHTHGINVMAGREPYSVANRVVTIVRRMYPDLGPVQTHLLSTAAYTVARREGVTLWDVLRFISDPRVRHDYDADEVAQTAWANPDKTAARGLSIRIGDMLNSPKLSRGLADPDGIDLDEEVRQNRVIVADLTQDDTADAQVLAAAIVNMLQQVSVRRKPDAQMYPCYLDEFQSYSDASIETWITEGGKRHMPLTLIHQNRSQIKGQERLAAAALSCGTIYCMRVNIHDARELATQLAVDDPTNLTALPTRTYYARILSRGRPIYRKARVPYVDLARRNDRAKGDGLGRDDDRPGKGGLLPRPVSPTDGTGASAGLVPGQEAG